MPRPVTLVPWTSHWTDKATALIADLRAAAPGVFVALLPIGSTAVPGLIAKPVIDLLGEVGDLAAIEAASAALEGLGWRARRERRRRAALFHPRRSGDGGAGGASARPCHGRPDDRLASGVSRPAEGRARDRRGLCGREAALRGRASGGQRGLCGVQEGLDGSGGGGGGG
ncbi:MAG: hypothetical protein EON96_04780 [Caulobacteraceae bacterium]|nr:MAG: hypothetical protein EON96_04780 [Caulobacteraceae bacterium]